MNSKAITQFQPTITGLDINLTRKQPCELQGHNCCTRSFSRFGITTEQYPNHKYACHLCACNVTGRSIFQLGMAEQYVQNVKPHIRDLKDKVHFHITPHHKNKNVTGQLKQTIGDLSIVITEFQNQNYGLIINGIPYQPNLRKNFLSYKKVCDFTVRVINNIYSDKILNYIHHGTQFIMPQ